MTEKLQLDVKWLDDLVGEAEDVIEGLKMAVSALK